MPHPSSDAAYRRLWATGALGWRTLQRLRALAGSWCGVLTLSEDSFPPGLRRVIRSARESDDPLDAWNHRGWSFCAPGDPSYPALWRRLPAPPGGVLVRGDADVLARAMVAIIGTRRPTEYGNVVGRALARAEAEAGRVVLAGLAAGIDAVAHESALDAGAPTVAVLPTSLDAVYPRAHRSLAERIVAAGGALVSEYHACAVPRAQHFHARNRLVAGLAERIVVVEAGERSGTMGTVQHALALGIEVCAVPGPITSPVSAGTNRLLADGATPILSLGEAASLRSAQDRDPIVQAIEAGASDIDGLEGATGIPYAELVARLTALELDGALRRSEDGRYVLR